MGKEILARGFHAADWEEWEDGLLLLSEKSVTQNWSRVETRWIAIRGTQRAEYRVAVRSYSAAELSFLLSQFGFAELRGVRQAGRDRIRPRGAEAGRPRPQAGLILAWYSPISTEQEGN